MMQYSYKATLVLAIVLFANGALADPYWYFGDAVEGTQQVAQEALPQAEQVGQQAGQQANPLPQRIQGHLGELMSHGGSAVKNVAESLRPDLDNIGKDLTEVYQVTRDNVNSKVVEPLSQTVRPYIDNAQKFVSPLVNQAKEEVPKLINQAGPALSRVGEQVRGGLSGVWNKISSATSGATSGNVADQAAAGVQQAATAGQQVVESGQQSASNAIQQGAEMAQRAAQ